MGLSSKLLSLVSILAGLALFVWLVYDASGLVAALGLGGVVSEAVVVLAGLVAIGAAVGFGAFGLWRARLRPAPRPSA